VALALKADGVHLGQDDLSPDAARQILGSDAIIGLSTHTLSEAAEAAKSTADYVAYGPIFETATKTDTSPVVGLESLKAIREVVAGKPLVAIGGISDSNATAVLAHGADSVAVISCLLMDAERIEQRTSALIASLLLSSQT
jgi:thiamine-phosphate pyrophosphorylase